jgi:hypothetical protein
MSPTREEIDEETTRLWEHVETFADLMEVVQRFARDLRVRARDLAEKVDARGLAEARVERSIAIAKLKPTKGRRSKRERHNE